MATLSMSAPAPADRAPGDRGARGRAAAVLVVAAVLALLATRFHGTNGSGESIGRWNISYSYENSDWSSRGLEVAVLGLVSAGMLLWLARRRLLVVLAAALAAVGIGALVWAIAVGDHNKRVSSVSYRAVALGTSESALTARFGSPMTSDATATRGEVSIGCLVYRAVPSPPPVEIHNSLADPDVTGQGAGDYAFCFDHGRVRMKAAF